MEENKAPENQSEDQTNPPSDAQGNQNIDQNIDQNNEQNTAENKAEGSEHKDAPELEVPSPFEEKARLDVRPVKHFYDAVKQEINRLVVGQDEMLELLVTAMLTGGHCLLEGLPGIAKTLTAKSLSKSIDVPFSRIQFTPDLMPTDVTGTSVFNLKSSEFNFKRGPIFSSIILIDEINRAPAKTQAALMEVMEEKQITYDGVTYPMEFPFFVIATQNPIEQEGTYALPEAQLDRFLFRIKMEYPSLNEEELILKRFERDFSMQQQGDVKAVVSSASLKEAQELIEQIYIKEELLKYIAAVVNNTRNNGDLHLGASPRASLAIMKCSKAFAALNGRDFVTPDDIKRVCIPILNHRVILSHEREMEGTTVEEVIKTILETVEVPR
ncbi:MAG: MoxR family ATPase [Flavobacteriales bacterium]|nr:MoxR family ATPase [Flavobacteriales bacterium]